MNIKTRLENNIAALKVAKIRMDNSYSPLDEKEQLEVLRGWLGVGGCKGVLNDWNVSKQQWIEDGVSSEDVHMYDLYQDLFEAIRDLFPFSEHKRVMDSVRNAVLTQFFTPEVVCRTFYDVLSSYLHVKNMYEPSAGSGVFVTTALEKFPEITLVEVCEKDKLTNKLLSVVLPPNIGKTRFYIQEAFEDADNQMDGDFDLLATNPPYGNINVYDKEYEKDKTKRDFCKRIHNYFVAKGIDKLRDGGVMALLITNAFLDTVSNKSICRYLFDRCDFISLTVMPDNLMYDTGGTMAPSHFLVVQKNSSKSELSPEEELLVESSFINASGGKYAMNNWLQNCDNQARVTIATGVSYGKNQYGKPAIEKHWSAPIEEIAIPFRRILERDFEKRFKKDWRNLNWGLAGAGETESDIIYDDPFDEPDPNSNMRETETWVDDDLDEEIDEPKLVKISENIELYEGTFPQEPVPELKEMLPEYVPFKNGIIVEYGK